jgi:hypothetical protein
MRANIVILESKRGDIVKYGEKLAAHYGMSRHTNAEYMGLLTYHSGNLIFVEDSEKDMDQWKWYGDVVLRKDALREIGVTE